MLAFSWSSTLGAIALTPWVALIGFDTGVLGGAVAALLAAGLWFVSTDVDGITLTAAQIAIRAASFLVIGLLTGFAGRRLRASEERQRAVSSLQSALIDAALDGICLTDADGEILISNKPLRKLSSELGMPASGTVPERLLAIRNTLVDPERYAQRMRELATSPDESTSDEFEVADSGRVFRGYTSPVTGPGGGFYGRVWTLREVTADRELDRMR